MEAPLLFRLLLCRHFSNAMTAGFQLSVFDVFFIHGSRADDVLHDLTIRFVVDTHAAASGC